MGKNGIDHSPALVERERDAFAVRPEREKAIGAAVLQVGEVLRDEVEPELCAAVGKGRHGGWHDAR